MMSTYRILLTYDDQGNIILRGKGSGGLPEMMHKINERQIYVGVVRVRAVDEYGSRRAKFVYINYVGSDVVSIEKTNHPSSPFVSDFSLVVSPSANITCCESLDS